ncbi:hypothetical protein K469DRAFT_666166 [Zopfia rhizophila CBS 207.26]|uniref:Exosome complex protein n=1 Tax=Zopfia rhizophila CBS 207.26 TaxID=1314779 RepID=A0A6A6DYR4_9PEZI|nr:hypothetical protein K469DRAFT_666166 [Zopfia rhizophila CBS 207.26]
MDPINLHPQIEDLEANIDELEEALEPLLENPLLDIASKLPLLDKAKLYVLTTYAIESALFSTLQLSGINAKEHAVFQELARLKGYFGKVKTAELGPQEPKTKLNKGAAARFIKHGLAGNDRYDSERAERIAKEKAKAEVLKRQHVKFDDEREGAKGSEVSKKRIAEESGAVEEEEKDNVSSENEDFYGGGSEEKMEVEVAEPAKKKQRVTASDIMDVESPTTEGKEKKDKKRKQGKHKTRKELHRAERAARKAEHKQSPIVNRGRKDDVEREEEAIIPAKEGGEGAPKTRSETFNALLEGPLPKREKKDKEKKKAKT